jgi:hypothetical protein
MSLLATAGQMEAAKNEEFKNVKRALDEARLEHLDLLVQCIESYALYRAEKVVGPAVWLRDLQKSLQSFKSTRRENMIWRAIAMAPTGFCHPRDSVWWSIYEDVVAGLGFDEIKAKFDKKMHPLQYQRPQVMPAAGNIKRAEEIVAKLGLEPALHRRFARLDEIEKIWTPKITNPVQPEGVFGHLEPKGKKAKSKSMDLPSKTMTWVKFRDTMLSSAETIELLVPAHDNFVGLLTATNAEAPPILQWDRADKRNPVSFYVYAAGSNADVWKLHAHQWVEVPALCLRPCHWCGNAAPNFSQALIVVLKGATGKDDVHLCLFPETIKGELHEVRATIEAHSKSGRATGQAEGNANGLLFDSAAMQPWKAELRVNGTQLITLDRWD